MQWDHDLSVHLWEVSRSDHSVCCCCQCILQHSNECNLLKIESPGVKDKMSLKTIPWNPPNTYMVLLKEYDNYILMLENNNYLNKIIISNILYMYMSSDIEYSATK